MEFLHAESAPATIAELDLFKLPPTQTVIESTYDVEFRPIGTLAKSSVIEFIIPGSEHFTDLSASYLYAKMKINATETIAGATETAASTIKPLDVTPTSNFAAALFEQLDVYLGNVNITPGNSLYHYQSYLDDLFFKYKSPIDACQMIGGTEDERKERIKNTFDLIIPIHAPIFQQEKYLIDNVPITLRFKLAQASFPVKTDSKNSPKASIELERLSLFIKRVKLYQPVQMAITANLQKSPAKYYLQRNEVKAFHLPTGFAANSIDNIYAGQLPRKLIVGFIPDKAFNGDINEDCFKFVHSDLRSATIIANGIKIPSTSYQPDFKNKLYMREFYDAYRSMNQDTGIPKINLEYDKYADNYPLLVFDLTDDGTLASDSGALSLIKRGNVRMEVQFKEPLQEGLHMIVFAIYDNVLQIDAERNIVTDY